ncbi:UNVERIFIED_CONTAM: hypothetical protein Sradi_2173200 [Sesamum radiatum]|uniref:Remorin C-terminal domain-containing protein n=1 Tax=Sesamum radiatum TaxID=300843 RepID=A0AAW2T1I3_SESRA
MEYERIHKVQTGIISPSKLRMKLIGAHHQKKKDGSNSNSSRTSPSRLEDSEFVKNSLLAAPNGDFGEEGSSLEVPPIKSDSATLDASQGDGNSLQSKELTLRENGDTGRFRMQLVSKGDGGNSSSVHPVRTCEDENLDYDSTSSFEFHKGERSLHHSVARSFSRPMSSKWNDAEKWIMTRQNVQSNISKKTNLQNQVNRSSASNMTGLNKFAFASHGAGPVSGQVNGANALIDLCPESKDLTEVDDTRLACTKSVTEETTARLPPYLQLLEEEPAATPTEHAIGSLTQNLADTGKKDLSEQELKLKTRREIVALGVQLGKMNIAAWASKDEKEKSNSGNELDGDELEQIEYAKRAAAWEEAEKSKHAARFKREEIRIQAWESQQKAKLEAEMRKIEAQIEQMKAQAQAKMVKKIAMARQKSEEKRAAAEARKNQQAEKTAAQAEYIRQTGRIPSSPFVCCGWS